MNFIQDSLIYAKKITVGQTPKVSEFWLSKNVRTLKNVHLSSSVGQINEIQYRKETWRHSMWKTADATELLSIHGHGDNDNNGRWRNHKGSGVPAIGYRTRRLSTATTVNN